MNIDWSTNGESYEAIFYLNELEHIARIKNDGLLESLKINLPLNKLPLAIHKQVDQLGEVMSAIAIYRENMINYELIVRDHQLNRYFLLLDENGKVIEKEKL
ncbi:MAG TPA: hypothetical protein VKA27_15260 [Sunxiuqinia sp.]|nr:hypothetical protein [Sunxiuqinia sp.]